MPDPLITLDPSSIEAIAHRVVELLNGKKQDQPDGTEAKKKPWNQAEFLMLKKRVDTVGGRENSKAMTDFLAAHELPLLKPKTRKAM